MSVWRERIANLDGVIGAGVCVYDGWVHVLGGRRASNAVANTHRRWNPRTDEWQSLPSMPGSREFLGAVALPGFIYAVGGRSQTSNQGGVSSNLWRYNVSTRAWQAVPSMIYGRAAHFCGVLDGRIFVAGGWATSGSSAAMRTTVETYDPASNSWTEQAPLPFGLRLAHGAAVYVSSTQAIHLLGGENSNGQAVDLNLRFRFAQGWDARQPMPAVRRRHGGCLFNGRIFVAGAQDGDGNSVRQYDVASNQWVLPNPADLPTKRASGSLVAVAGRMEHVGGSTGNVATPTIVEYPYDPMFAPVIETMTGGVTLDQTQVHILRWRNSSPNLADVQSTFRWHYRIVGNATWNPVVRDQSATEYGVSLAAFPPGTYEHRIQVLNQHPDNWSPWSAIEQFTVAAIPTDVAITSPAAGVAVTTELFDVEWSTAWQTRAEVRRVADSSIQQPNTGTVYQTVAVESSTARSARLNFPVEGRHEHIQVRIERNGVWSAWVSRRVFVTYSRPSVPTFAVYEDDANGRITIVPGAGTAVVQDLAAATMDDHVLLTWSPATASVDETGDVASVEIWRRTLDTSGTPVTGSEVRIGRTAGYRIFHDYRVAHNVPYAYRLVAWSVQGASASSDWRE